MNSRFFIVTTNNGLILFIMFWFACSVSVAAVTLEQDGNLDSTIYALITQNRMEINSFQVSYFPLVTEKENLLNSANFSYAPSFSFNRDGITPVFKGTFGGNQWNAVFDINPVSQLYINSGSVMAKLMSSNRKMAILLDSLINIEQEQAFYQTEKHILEDLKVLWGIVLEIMNIDEKVKIRDYVGGRIDSTGKSLSVFVKAGYTSQRNTDQLRMTFLENRMQNTILQQKTSLLKNSLESRFQISPEKIEFILKENKDFLTKFEKSNFINCITEKSRPSIDDLLGSLNAKEIQFRRSYDTHARYELKAGPIINFTGKMNDPITGIGAQFSLSFLNKKSNCLPRGISSSPSPVPPIQSEIDKNLESEVLLYVLKIDSEIENVFKEMEVGSQQSLSSLNDLYSKMINAKINVADLKYVNIGNKLNDIQSLEEISMRSRLRELLLKSKRAQ